MEADGDILGTTTVYTSKEECEKAIEIIKGIRESLQVKITT